MSPEMRGASEHLSASSGTAAPATFYERAVIARVCLSCAQSGADRETQDLCTNCWGSLDPITRARLRQRDHDAYLRQLQLLSSIYRGVRLADIRVSA